MKKKKLPIYRRLSPPMLIIGGFAALFGVYIVIYILAALAGGVSTVVATSVVADQSFEGSGWFFRDESVIDGNSNSAVRYLVSNGEKIQSQATLAVVYQDENALDNSRKIEEISSEITLLRAALQSAGGYVDSSKTDNLIAKEMQTIHRQASTGIVSDLSDSASVLRQLFLRRSAPSLSKDELETQISQLQQRRTQLRSQTESKSHEIISPASGYFCEIVDGYENIFTMEKLESLTPTELQNYVGRDVAVPNNRFGKVVSGFECYFAMLVTPEQAELLQQGQSVDLRFSQLSSDIRATVEKIVRDQSDYVLVVFKNDQLDSDLISMRNQTVEVIVSTATGIKVPKSAITLQQDETTGEQVLGVYILTGNTARFKEVDTIYEDESFYLVRQTSNTTSGLVAGDKIITRARGLSDMKVIR